MQFAKLQKKNIRSYFTPDEWENRFWQLRDYVKYWEMCAS